MNIIEFIIKLNIYQVTFHIEIHLQTTNQLLVHKLPLYFEILRFPDLYNPVYQLQYQIEQDHP
jgi:hypothetical protein